MATSSLLSYEFLGTFLLSLMLPTCIYSYSSHEIQLQYNYNIPSKALAATPQNLIQQYLHPLNRVQAQLGLNLVKWIEKLARFAKSWGNQRRKDCALIHSNGNYGENIFWRSGKNWKPSDAVAAWAAEKPYYDHKNNRCVSGHDCLHYTQIAWEQSLSVGGAKVICNSGDTFITCNYDPHGNVIGKRPF